MTTKLLKLLNLDLFEQKLLWFTIASRITFIISGASHYLPTPLFVQFSHNLLDSLNVLASSCNRLVLGNRFLLVSDPLFSCTLVDAFVLFKVARKQCWRLFSQAI